MTLPKALHPRRGVIVCGILRANVTMLSTATFFPKQTPERGTRPQSVTDKIWIEKTMLTQAQTEPEEDETATTTL